MNTKTVTIDKSIFKSKLIPIAMLFFAVASILSIITVIKFFDPQSIIAIRSKFIANDITDPDAIKTYTFIYILGSVSCLISSIVLTVGLFLNVIGKNYAGFNFLYYCAKGIYYFISGAGVATAVYFVYRMVRFLIVSWKLSPEASTIIAAFAALFWEIILGAIVAFCFIKLRSFLYSCIITTTSMNYTISLNKMEAPSLPPISILGFLVFGIIDFYMVFDRLILFSYAAVNGTVEHYISVSPVIMQRVSATPFFFAGIGSILIYMYLRFYKQKSERLLNVTIKDVLN